MRYINNVSSRDELAIFLDMPIKKLTHQLYVNKPDLCYTSFKIKKKSGGYRQIDAPSDELIGVQRKIAVALWEYESYLQNKYGIKSNISHAFEKEKSIFTNASIHKNKRIVLNLDLNDFFPSIHFGRVQGFFMKNKDYNLPYEVATILAQLCCYKGKLPQGAPTSPIISNLICRILDIRLLKLAKEYRVDYTRYADDLTFSTNNKAFLEKQNEFLESVTAEIERAGFSVNDKKTRIQYKNGKQVVTGLIVNKKINIDRNYYRETRAMAHSLYKNNEYLINAEKGTLNQLEGRFSFINQIDKLNNTLDFATSFKTKLRNGNEESFRRFKVDAHTFRNLNGKEEQYRAFIFYKYFYGSDMPVIVTEGKTDKKYLQAALKNLYNDYPELIEKTSDGFRFKVRFLNRTKRLEYFFSFGLDGADAMKNLYNFFSGESNFKNYYKMFAEKTSNRPSNPVIFVFDNETVSDRPLKNFLKYVRINDKTKEAFLLNQYYKLDIVSNIKDIKDSTKLDKLSKNSNLYLLTNPLVNNKAECEIEHLFDKNTLSHKINGRSFSLKDADKNKYYNKDIFSKYVYANYKTIDFSNFKPLLNNLNKIVKEYRENV